MLFLGRSGSTYLMEALDAHPQVDARFEELGSRRESGSEEQLRFARDFFGAERDAPVSAAGFKTKLQDVLDRDGFGRLLQDVGARTILLQRRNVVRAVVSWFRSELVHGATGDWNVYRSEDRPPPMTIDPAEFSRRLESYERSREQLRQYALGLERPTLMLFYEDLLVDPDSTLGMVCGFLGVSPIPLRGKALKATPDDLRLAVTNAEDLRKVVGPHHRRMFDTPSSF